jgi:ribonuclease J
MKVHTISGYEEVGRNMTAVEYQGKAVIFDMGYEMEEVIAAEGDVSEMTTNQALETGAIPRDKQLFENDVDVVGIVIGHGHLDHVGAIPKLAGSYNCDIYATPYTADIVEMQIEDDRKRVNNQIKRLNTGEETSISEDFSLEFAHVNHSIPQATLSLLDTPEGYVVYGNDMKIDRSPVGTTKTDMEKLRELRDEENVKAMIPGTTRVGDEGRTMPEQAVAVELEDTLESAYQSGGAVFISTFSSQIARLNTILEANGDKRKVAFVGRSLKEYAKAAEKRDLIDLSQVEVASYYDECEEVMKEVQENREEYLVVATGNQGEPGAQLDKMASGKYPFEFEKGDHMIFSSQVIPTPPTQANRYTLEKKLKSNGVRIYKDIHTSGHARKEDHRDFIHALKPENIVPSHGGIHELAEYVELAREEGYSLNEDVFISSNQNTLEI